MAKANRVAAVLIVLFALLYQKATGVTFNYVSFGTGGRGPSRPSLSPGWDGRAPVPTRGFTKSMTFIPPLPVAQVSSTRRALPSGRDRNQRSIPCSRAS